MMEMNDDILDRLKAGRKNLPAFLLVSGSIAHNGWCYTLVLMAYSTC